MTNTPEITVQELAAMQKSKENIVILDVRNQDEYDFCNIQGLLIPWSELPSRVSELDPDATIVIHCHAGGRSRKATQFLLEKGFTKVFNLKGGITAWANEIDNTMPTY